MSKRLSREQAATWLKKIEELERDDNGEGEDFDNSQLKRELKAIVDTKQKTLDELENEGKKT